MKYEEYENYKKFDLQEIDINSLIQISAFNLELPYEKRIKQFISERINPYVFVSHGLKVQTIYKDTDISISDLLVKHFSNLK